ncbi:TRAP transporter permease [Dysosmobacter sp.]|uniref:TRAP transporter permease n=1 Tax=Dysosmobacter sp. TaxID=2591382 RepID=UPI002A84F1F9|nr:TRAP transporter fused permease subunit [Dysosmobacter sp.]MDY3986157.1 TRAP transporter fused permease subunit [Dysosmobacter sp.]
MTRALKRLELTLCICFVLFQMYTAFFGAISGIAQKSIHLTFVIAILFIGLYNNDHKHKTLQVLDLVLMVIGCVVTIYITTLSKQLAIDNTTHTVAMSVFGVLLIAILLVATWRKVGPVLAIVVAFFVFYAFFGKMFPLIFRHGGMKFTRFIHLICYTSEGIFGSPLNSAATFICVFIILGALFAVTGVGDYITELASSVFGVFRGGPAKVAVVASALFGSISGSACANVIGTGTFTIPLMKRIGYDGEFAGAVEATASTGGQIMPPIMGAAAFLVAEILGVRYWDVVKAAIIPAILFYVALLIAVDLYALSHGLVGMKRSELPPLSKTIRGIWKFSPMLVLILMIGPMNFTITRSGVYTFLFTLALSFVSKETRLNREKLTQFLYSAGRGCCTVAIACAVVGIIIGTVTGTGLSYRLSSILVDIAGGKLALLLIITMFAAIILGMGLPSSACYLVLATLVAPAIIQLGVLPMAAHLFVFYYGIISNVTPPVAMAAYAAAGIADCNPSRCGFQAFRLSIAGFLLPFFFVYNNVLLFDGTPLAILIAFLGAVVGIYCLACSMQGYIWNAPINFVGRVLLFAAAISLIDSAVLTDMIGLALMIAVHVFFNMRKKNAVPVPQ